jgi:hypothetical protein
VLAGGLETCVEATRRYAAGALDLGRAARATASIALAFNAAVKHQLLGGGLVARGGVAAVSVRHYAVAWRALLGAATATAAAAVALHALCSSKNGHALHARASAIAQPFAAAALAFSEHSTHVRRLLVAMGAACICTGPLGDETAWSRYVRVVTENAPAGCASALLAEAREANGPARSPGGPLETPGSGTPGTAAAPLLASLASLASRIGTASTQML